jgi:hypothetical protein
LGCFAICAAGLAIARAIYWDPFILFNCLISIILIFETM